MDMLVVSGVIEVALEDAATFRAAAAEAARETRANDAGCLLYSFYEDVEQPGRFRVYEEWTDQAALTAHGEAAHMDAFRAKLADVTFVSRDIRKHDGHNPRALDAD